jgi:hypothetical protein
LLASVAIPQKEISAMDAFITSAAWGGITQLINASVFCRHLKVPGVFPSHNNVFLLDHCCSASICTCCDASHNEMLRYLQLHVCNHFGDWLREVASTETLFLCFPDKCMCLQD